MLTQVFAAWQPNNGTRLLHWHQVSDRCCQLQIDGSLCVLFWCLSSIFQGVLNQQIVNVLIHTEVDLPWDQIVNHHPVVVVDFPAVDN